MITGQISRKVTHSKQVPETTKLTIIEQDENDIDKQDVLPETIQVPPEQQEPPPIQKIYPRQTRRPVSE